MISSVFVPWVRLTYGPLPGSRTISNRLDACVDDRVQCPRVSRPRGPDIGLLQLPVISSRPVCRNVR